MNYKKVVIIGANGLLGSTLSCTLKNKGYHVVTVTHTSLGSDYQSDVSEKKNLDTILQTEQPEIIINLAALTNVEQCELETDKAEKLNINIPKNIANSSYQNAFIIHISTDHIYNKNNADETEISLINNYAKTKYLGEKEYDLSKSIILRTNFFGKSKSNNSVGLCDFIYNSAQQGAHLNLFNDVFFSPISINSLVKYIELVIQKKHTGIYNLGSRNGMTKGDFIYKFLNYSSINDFNHTFIPMPHNNDINRPHDMRMNVDKFQNVFSLILPTLDEEIRNVSNDFKFC
ncbi:SDR family oxidoreductase [Providencia sp.]|uniref:SDR family oxidoreductase n=1 Tax=Providencia sp. TaxID=589 RepID=UPI003F962B1B